MSHLQTKSGFCCCRSFNIIVSISRVFESPARIHQPHVSLGLCSVVVESNTAVHLLLPELFNRVLPIAVANNSNETSTTCRPLDVTSVPGIPTRLPLICGMSRDHNLR